HSPQLGHVAHRCDQRHVAHHAADKRSPPPRQCGNCRPAAFLSVRQRVCHPVGSFHTGALSRGGFIPDRALDGFRRFRLPSLSHALWRDRSTPRECKTNSIRVHAHGHRCILFIVLRGADPPFVQRPPAGSHGGFAMNRDMPAAFPQGKGASRETMLTIPCTQEGAPARLVTIFGSLAPNREKRVHYIFDLGGPDYTEIVLTADRPIASIARQAPAAAWYERELHDQYGIEITGHPDLRPLILHENWPDGVYPMVDPSDNVPSSKRDYHFLQVQGEGVAEVAVGPVHAGIIEPGHFRFSVIGDTILHLELRHFYTHKGTEKLFEGWSATDAAILAESVSGDNCFAHAVCYSQAVENACGIDIPPRASAIRLVGLELERLVCHISDVGGLCTDVGFGVAAAYSARLKESLLRESAQCCRTRYWRGITIPGGLRFDLDSDRVAQLGQAVARASREFS